MDTMEIINDALKYPLSNVKALLIYVILGIFAYLVLVVTGVGAFAGVLSDHVFAGGLIGIVGCIISILIFLLIDGYGLDVIKFGIDRVDESPGIDFGRQVSNGIKLIIVHLVYFIILFIVMFILSYISSTLALIVGFILGIVFLFALTMSECRLANTGSLGEALNIPGACGDVTKVGIGKILAVVILMVIIFAILGFISSIFTVFGDVGSYISAILSGILGIYGIFVVFRATGLLYSDVA